MPRTPRIEDALLSPREVVFTRAVKAERSLVWRLWTESRHLAQWWGPYGFTNPECAIDPRPGGRLRILMRSPEGGEYLNVGAVQVLDPPARLVFTVALLNPDGSRRLENRVTADFADRGGETEVTVRVEVLHATPEAREDLAGMSDGWNGSLHRLSMLVAEGAVR
ncbi:MAG TPA: SRPBCC domain-containing protein [Amycolatopsis sp.]